MINLPKNKVTDLPHRQVKGYVHSIETGGMVDGPGIRYVVFFAGCALRCKYCHNPDTWKLKDGRLYSVGEIVDDIQKYKSYLSFSKGGVTITGGDPFVQPDFLAALLAACSEAGFHTALDTSGYASQEAAALALANTDLLILDIKTINPTVYKKITGVRLDRTLEMLQLSQLMGVPVWIRFVLVPGLTDSLDDIREMADYLKNFDNIEKVEVLPFHKMGEFKWEALGLTYELADVEPPSADMLVQAKGLLENFR